MQTSFRLQHSKTLSDRKNFMTQFISKIIKKSIWDIFGITNSCDSNPSQTNINVSIIAYIRLFSELQKKKKKQLKKLFVPKHDSQINFSDNVPFFYSKFDINNIIMIWKHIILSLLYDRGTNARFWGGKRDARLTVMACSKDKYIWRKLRASKRRKNTQHVEWM